MDNNFVKSLIEKCNNLTGYVELCDYLRTLNRKEKKNVLLKYFDYYFEARNGLYVVKNGKPINKTNHESKAKSRLLFSTDELKGNYLKLENELPIFEYYNDDLNFFVATTDSIYSMVGGKLDYCLYTDFIDWDDNVLAKNDYEGLVDFLELGFKTQKVNIRVVLENRFPFSIALRLINILSGV